MKSRFRCKNENCEGNLLITDTDNRQEWCEETLECEKCGRIYTHRTDWDNGLVTKDILEEEK